MSSKMQRQGWRMLPAPPPLNPKNHNPLSFSMALSQDRTHPALRTCVPCTCMMCPVDTSCTDVSAATPAPAHASLQSQWSCCLCPPLPPSGGSREQNSTYPSSLLIFSVAAVRSQYLLKTAVSVSCFGCQFFFRQLLILAVNSFHSINRGCTPSIQHSSHREQGCKQEFIECKPSIHIRNKAF